MPEQVHVLVEVDPQFGVHRLVKNLKGVWSHTLRQEFRTPATAGVALKAPSFSCGA
jgi:REP element-mobilizing transposase RayT